MDSGRGGSLGFVDLSGRLGGVTTHGGKGAAASGAGGGGGGGEGATGGLSSIVPYPESEQILRNEASHDTIFAAGT